MLTWIDVAHAPHAEKVMRLVEASDLVLKGDAALSVLETALCAVKESLDE